MDISIVIPCYRDAPHLERNVKEILAVLEATRWDYELILVDDRSPDDCRRIIDKLIADHPGHPIRKIFHEENTGRGQAVNDGLHAATGTVAGFLDIDLEVAAHYIPLMVRSVLGGSDVAIGRRVYKLRWNILHRALMSRGYHWLSNRILGMRLEDTESGYKFFRREKILPVVDSIEDRRWFWDTEVVVRAVLAGLKVTFEPVLFIRQPDKATTVRLFGDSLDYLRNLWRFRRTVRQSRPPSHPDA